MAGETDRRFAETVGPLVVAYAAGDRSRNAIAAIHATIARLSRAICWQAGRPEMEEDLAQDVWLLMPKIASEYRPEVPFEAYLLGYLRLMIRTRGRKFDVAMSTDEREESPEDNDFDRKDVVESPEDCVIEDIDRKLAMSAITSHPNFATSDIPMKNALPFVSVKSRTPPAGAPVPEAALVPPRKSRSETSATLAADHQELRNIRIALGMTQTEFANAIGCKVPTLVAYEHGRTQRVKSDYMDRARELRASDSGDRLEWRKKFDNRSMDEILNDWAARLGVDPEDLNTMASLTGTVTSTISRWRRNKVKPTLAELIAYDKVVEINQERLRKSGEKISGDAFVSVA